MAETKEKVKDLAETDMVDVTAEEAAAMGMIYRVVDDERLQDEARSMTAQLAAMPAAALASMTDWGMSFGPVKAPQAKMPGREVATGSKLVVRAKPSSI